MSWKSRYKSRGKVSFPRSKRGIIASGRCVHILLLAQRLTIHLCAHLAENIYKNVVECDPSLMKGNFGQILLVRCLLSSSYNILVNLEKCFHTAIEQSIKHPQASTSLFGLYRLLPGINMVAMWDFAIVVVGIISMTFGME